MQVPEDILQLVEKGEVLSIVGGESDEAVLCSQTRTFSVKRVESSNSVYCVPPASRGGGGFRIESLAHDYYELRPIQGKVEQLKTLLAPTIYRGSGVAALDGSAAVTREAVARCVQASAAEVDAFMRTLGVVELQGALRWLSAEAVQESTAALLQSISAEGWPVHDVCEDACAAVLADIDPVILKHVLGLLGSRSGAGRWALDPAKVAAAAAHIVFAGKLAQGVKLVAREEFLREWLHQTPGSATREDQLDLALLRGVALTEAAAEGHAGASSTVFYRYLPLRELSPDAEKRFAQLFAVKQKFQLEELEPYVQDLFGSAAGMPRSQAELLLRHTRLIDGLYYPLSLVAK